MSDYTYLGIEVADGIATVTLDRPERLNALHPPAHEEFERVWPDLQERAEVTCVILRGRGTEFSAGGDVKDMLERVRADPDGGSGISPARARRLVTAMLDFEKPLIAAVEGRAFGLGATIALLCDFVVASETARFSDPHVDVALVPGDGGAAVWTVLVGPHRARLLLLTGGVVTAAQALEWGLLADVTAPGTAEARAQELARELGRRSQGAVRGTKISVNAWLKAQFQPILETSLAFERASLQDPDFTEALSALAAKRPPHFRRA
jgi:enoyl-CoA hydratase